MKRIFVVLLSAVLAMGFCSCTQSPSSSDTADKNSLVGESSIESQASLADSSSKSTEKYESFHGYMYSHPSQFNMNKYVLDAALNVFYGKLNTESDICLFLEQRKLDIVDNDVAAAFQPYIQKVLEAKYNAFGISCSCVPENETEVKLLEKDFIRQTGIINTDLDESDIESSKLYYTAYYGLMDFPEHGYVNQPMIVMAFSKGTDEQTKKDVQAVADQAYSSFQVS